MDFLELLIETQRNRIVFNFPDCPVSRITLAVDETTDNVVA